jgi:hypothetical protein
MDCECSVCFEEGLYTNCGHNLCHSCYLKLNDKICPICRGKITNISLNATSTITKRNKKCINDICIAPIYLGNNEWMKTKHLQQLNDFIDQVIIDRKIKWGKLYFKAHWGDTIQYEIVDDKMSISLK